MESVNGEKSNARKKGTKMVRSLSVKRKKHLNSKLSLKSKKMGGSQFVDQEAFTEEYGSTENADALDEVHPKKWYEDMLVEFVQEVDVDSDNLNALRIESKKLYEDAVTLHNNNLQKSKSSNQVWIKTVLSKGTISDRIAAYTLLIQEDPVHNLQNLNNMVSMVKVGKKKECFIVIDTLVELFLSSLLPPERKLIPFNNRPLSKIHEITSKSTISRKQLLYFWYFEDQLKQTYRNFILALNQAGHDSVEANKEKVVTALYTLLEGNPEQEAALLNYLVNKLGDPSHKVGSKVIYGLTKILSTHPNMKTVIMEEVEKLIFRPNIGNRAQYYSICFLSQYSFSSDDTKVAANLIKIYFSLFKACIKKGDIDSRMMTALLTGVNRAYPYAKQSVESLSEHIDTMYKIIHLAKFNVAVHALCLLFQVADIENSISDRYFTVLYKKISDPQFATSQHHAVFLSLIFKSLNKDTQENRIRVVIKRLLQVCSYMPVPVVCGILFIISQIIKIKKSLNLLPLTLEMDPLTKLELDEEDDEYEHYEDIKLKEEKSALEAEGESSDTKYKEEKIIPTWHHSQNLSVKSSEPKHKEYTPFCRNPLYAGGQKCSYIELVELVKHFHPTVSLFAAKLLDGEKISYTGDPLQDFTLPHFLDRFCFKNPKKEVNNSKEGNHFRSVFDRKKNYVLSGVKSLPVTSVSYLKQNEKQIPVDELYLHSYLKKKQEKGLKATQKGEESDNDSVGSEEFDEMLEGIMGGHGKDEINFANEIGQLPKKDKKVKGKRIEEEEEDSEIDGSDENEDERSDDEDFDENASGEDDGSAAEDFDGNELDDLGSGDDMDGSDIDTDFMQSDMAKDLKNKNSDISHLFTSAEKISEMFEESGSSKFSGTFSNKDNAALKQLQWEVNRDRWIKDRSRKKRKGNWKPPEGKKRKHK